MGPDAKAGATSAGAPFYDYLVGNRALVEEALARAMAPVGQDDDLESFLYAPLRDFTMCGGKRTRPILCLLGAEAVGGDKMLALSSGVAVELFQSAALIHDDIADESPLRRGKPCMHVSQGVGPAINVGDGALVEAAMSVLHDDLLDDATRLRVLGELMEMERRTVEGQALDLCWGRDGRWDVTTGDYMRMASLKTAYYSCAVPLALGAICAGGSDGQVEALRAFGLDAGLAFQLQDDLLDLLGDEKRQGKAVMGDITEGKRTLAVVFSLENAAEGEREELVEILSSHTSDPARQLRARQIMMDCGAIDYVRGTAIGLVAKAKGHLFGTRLAEESHVVLESMADFFVERLR